MFFENVCNLNELKSEYKRLVMKHHPDMGGDLRTMQTINAEYDKLFAQLKVAHNTKAATDKDVKPTTETPEEFRAVVEAIINLDGIEIELCGSWLWVSGETYKHKDALKTAGYKWSRNKKMWYWHHAEAGAHWSRGKYTMDEIRNTYGSEKLQFTSRKEIAAA